MGDIVPTHQGNWEIYRKNSKNFESIFFLTPGDNGGGMWDDEYGRAEYEGELTYNRVKIVLRYDRYLTPPERRVLGRPLTFEGRLDEFWKFRGTIKAGKKEIGTFRMENFPRHSITNVSLFERMREKNDKRRKKDQVH